MVTYLKEDLNFGHVAYLPDHGRRIASYEEAARIAEVITEQAAELWLPYDAGEGRYPKYGCFRAPKVGDRVSDGFNGDFYPQGTIVKITPGSYKRITTDTGTIYNRVRLTSSWRKRGGTWWMSPGWSTEKNPSF